MRIKTSPCAKNKEGPCAYSLYEYCNFHVSPLAIRHTIVQPTLSYILQPNQMSHYM